ncbi:MAG TPA: 7-carboxy-7-deazaguanine synthase QueE [Lacipirellulaceae bacterium]|nr:7-carboxy-7-deazaguanine synthase QueE [Lacipirellulaceae bacterium]
MRIAEIYRSVQGEGFLTGVPSVFVRASGCNLRCWFCDTPYASWEPEGRDMSTDEIVSLVEEWDSKHVVVTGGEPMLFAELIPLCARLQEIGRHVTIETAGTLELSVACDLMSISPKFASSVPDAKAEPHWHRRHERERHRPGVIRKLVSDYEYQLKFVVDSADDMQAVREYLAEFPEISREQVLVMPQGTDQEQLDARAEWLKPFCEAEGFVFCPRKQIEWFGPVRGT